MQQITLLSIAHDPLARPPSCEQALDDKHIPASPIGELQLLPKALIGVDLELGLTWNGSRLTNLTKGLLNGAPGVVCLLFRLPTFNRKAFPRRPRCSAAAAGCLSPVLSI